MLLMVRKRSAQPVSPPQRPTRDPFASDTSYRPEPPAILGARVHFGEGEDGVAQAGRKDEGMSPRSEPLRDSLRKKVS